MIYGDPFRFALQFDAVEEWNSIGSEWRNGLFAIFVDGKNIFSSIDVVELRTTFRFFESIPMGAPYFGTDNLTAREIFQAAHKYFMGDGEEYPEGVVSLTCTAMGDVGCYVFLVTTTSGDRIVWSLDEGVTVSECLLEAGTVAKVIGSTSHGAI